MSQCKNCRGTRKARCVTCKGEGVIKKLVNRVYTKVSCRRCNRSGRDPQKECPHCRKKD